MFSHRVVPNGLRAMLWKSLTFQKRQKKALICQIILVILILAFFSIMLAVTKAVSGISGDYKESTSWPRVITSYRNGYVFDQVMVVDAPSVSGEPVGWGSHEVTAVEDGLDSYGDTQYRYEREGDGLFGSIPFAYSSYKEFASPFVNETRTATSLYDMETILQERRTISDSMQDEWGWDYSYAKISALTLPDNALAFTAADILVPPTSGDTYTTNIRATMPIGDNYNPSYQLTNTLAMLWDGVIDMIAHRNPAETTVTAGETEWGQGTAETLQYPYKVYMPLEVDFVLVCLLLSLTFLTLSSNRVKESKQGVKEILRLAGLQSKAYHTSWFVSNAVIGGMISLVTYIVGWLIFRVPFFKSNSILSVLTLIVGWAFCLSAFTNLFFSLMRTSGASSLLALLLLAVTPLVYMTQYMNGKLTGDVGIGYILLEWLYPLWTLASVVGEMCSPYFSLLKPSLSQRVSTKDYFSPLMFSPTEAGAGFWLGIVRLVFVTVFCHYVSYWVEEIRPSDTGKKGRSPLFFIKSLSRPSTPSPTDVSESMSAVRQSVPVGVSPVREHPAKVSVPGSVEAAAGQVRTILSTAASGDESMPVLVVDTLKKEFPGGIKAVDGLSFSVSKGGCFGLLGQNGCGKTTTLNMICGLLDPSGGNVFIDGVALHGEKGRSLTQSGWMPSNVGFCPQNDHVWAELSVYEHIKLFSWLKSDPYASIDEDEMDSTVKGILKQVGLRHAPNKLAGELSGGMRRRLSLAIALCGAPSLLLLDEPSCGLDPATKRDVIDVIRPLKEDMAIILTSSP
ncbi:ABC transporter A, ABCA [Kipferlia bialata]|uniref:ABC transporter A, ABCA n=1 Tax=Kipferlia bialata TaxID=797122 RepID=A0A9K3CZQ1_9EUKA|nr:ABC transporter A, ABCA [Kipferlia bialata]|eukprot:g7781.t1